jgi:hypothetical protein
MTARCRAAKDSMVFLPSSSVSPNAYSESLVENKLRASANVIHLRAPAGNADNERASAISVVPSSFVASGGAGVPAPNSLPIRFLIPIRAAHTANPPFLPQRLVVVRAVKWGEPWKNAPFEPMKHTPARTLASVRAISCRRATLNKQSAWPHC